MKEESTDTRESQIDQVDLCRLYRDAKRECQSWPLCHDCPHDHGCTLREIFELCYAMTENIAYAPMRPGETPMLRLPGLDIYVGVICDMIIEDCQQILSLRESPPRRPLIVAQTAASSILGHTGRLKDRTRASCGTLGTRPERRR